MTEEDPSFGKDDFLKTIISEIGMFVLYQPMPSIRLSEKLE